MQTNCSATDGRTTHVWLSGRRKQRQVARQRLADAVERVRWTGLVWNVVDGESFKVFLGLHLSVIALVVRDRICMHSHTLHNK